MKTHDDIALHCLAHLRDTENDGSDNLLFLGIFRNALKAASKTIESLEVHVTETELEEHRVKGCLASAARILAILRAGENTCTHILVEHLLNDLDEGGLTPEHIGSCMEELHSFRLQVA